MWIRSSKLWFAECVTMIQPCDKPQPLLIVLKPPGRSPCTGEWKSFLGRRTISLFHQFKAVILYPIYLSRQFRRLSHCRLEGIVIVPGASTSNKTLKWFTSGWAENTLETYWSKEIYVSSLSVTSWAIRTSYKCTVWYRKCGKILLEIPSLMNFDHQNGTYKNSQW